MGKLRWEGARPDAGRDEAVEIAWGNCAGWERDSMLDGKLCGSATACWTGQNRGNSWGNFGGRERDRMLDGEESVQIACGKLRWKGARQHAGRDDAVEIA